MDSGLLATRVFKPSCVDSQSDCWHVHATFRGIFEFHMMAFCEPRRSSAYSEDLRWTMVWQSEALGCSYSTITQNLNVDKSTVCRTLQLFYSTGTVSKHDYPKKSAARKLSYPVQLFILHLVIKRPGIYLYEIQNELSDLLGIEVFQQYSVFYMRTVLPDRSFKSLQYREMSF